MAERAMTGTSRPKPGPKKRAAGAHGTAKRRTAHHPHQAKRPKTSLKQKQSTPKREPVVREPLDPQLNRRLWALVVVAGLIAAVVSVLEAPAFEARSVQVSGAARTSEGAILDSLAIPVDQALLTYDTGGAEERVAELPWIDEASVVRQWPSTVRVVVREHAVTATVGTASGRTWVVLGEDRLALEFRLTPPAGAPVIVAPDEVIDAVAIGEPVAGIDRAFTVARDVPGQLAPWIDSWAIDADGNLWANLVGSAHANLGVVGDYRTQFVSLASILGGSVSPTCLSVIDLTIADTPVIHRDQSCLLASQEL